MSLVEARMSVSRRCLHTHASKNVLAAFVKRGGGAYVRRDVGITVTSDMSYRMKMMIERSSKL